MDAQRALLDELMGAARNLTEEEKKDYREIHWDDREVCGPFMVRFCPHDLFVNTKSDLGLCPKIHDLKLKERYQKIFELYFLETCNQLKYCIIASTILGLMCFELVDEYINFISC
ncbi:luc7-like protein 3 [Dendrobium catenatum]|uniref:luc7-like protein 3 n=1 Tax=Dendrobium catenatum TaxID=906689 RepID=UPI00109FEB6C|nr:luc7-like protein 3 [Dendrobium catenatum]